MSHPRLRILRKLTAIGVLVVASCQQGDSQHVEGTTLTNKLSCARIGWEYYERFKRLTRETPVPVLEPGTVRGVIMPVFAYNAKLDTCLCMTGQNVPTSLNGAPILQRHIQDVLSNTTVAEFASETAPQSFKDRFQEVMGFKYSDGALDPEMTLEGR